MTSDTVSTSFLPPTSAARSVTRKGRGAAAGLRFGARYAASGSNGSVVVG